MNLFTTLGVTWACELAFTHFMKELMATRINWCLLLAFGLTSPITLIPHIANGHWDVKFNRRVGCIFIFSLYTWHLWHFLIYFMQSLSMVLKKYSDICTCLEIICPLTWVAQIPSWASWSVFFAYIPSKHLNNFSSDDLLYNTSNIEVIVHS